MTKEMLRLLATAAVLLVLTPLWVDSAVTAITKRKGQVLVKRNTLSNSPSESCNSTHEGRKIPVGTEIIWLCRSGKWIPYKLLHGNGAEYPACSCQEVRDVRLSTPPSGAYYINTTDPCTKASTIMKVYCNMDDDIGGWTLVWKHSPQDSSVLPLNDSMKYFSDYYKACTDIEVGWCNIPNKARLNPTEMMIAAYHNKRLVFSYKGNFNWNIDKDWTGGYLLNYTKVVDKCAQGNGIPPMPNTYSGIENILGLVFGKRGTYMNYKEGYCNDYYVGLSNPGECRWWDCQLPSTISSTAQYTQMTMAIYVR